MFTLSRPPKPLAECSKTVGPFGRPMGPDCVSEWAFNYALWKATKGPCTRKQFVDWVFEGIAEQTLQNLIKNGLVEAVMTDNNEMAFRLTDQGKKEAENGN
jgi:hypothetical protein